MFEEISFVSAGRFTARETWLHPARLLDTDEVICVVQGPVHIAVEDDFYTLRDGDALLLEQGRRHRGTRESGSGVSFYWMHFRRPSGLHLPFRQLSSLDSAQLPLLCRQLLHVSCGGYPAEAADYALRLILIELCRLCRPLETDSPTALQIAEWVRINCDRPLTVSDVAEHFGYNPDYLSRLYRRSDPRGLKACIDETRLQNVKRLLLATDLPLKEVAKRCGFDDYKYFLKYFVYHEETTPTRFRAAFFRQHTNNR